MALVKSAKGWRAEIEHVAMENIKSCFFFRGTLLDQS